MKEEQDNRMDSDALRRRAKKQLIEMRKSQGAKSVDPAMSVEMQQLVQKLEIHQIELEIQNEELQRTLAELTQSKNKYADFYDFTPVGYLTFDETGRILEANLTASKLLGVARVSLMKKPFTLFVQPESKIPFRFFLEKIFSEKSKQTCELKILKNELIIDLEGIVAVSDTPDATRFCRAVMINVTARKQVEADLHRYELLAVRHRDIILFIELPNGRIVEANDAATRAYGYTREQLLSMTIHDLRAADVPRLTPDQISMAYDQGLLFEMIHRRQAGDTFPVEVSAQGTEIGGKRVLISLIRDITKRKRIESELNDRTATLEERTRELEAANKDLESFSYSVSHDLKAPLRAIDGFSRMLIKKYGNQVSEDAARMLNIIRDNTDRMGTLIDGILSFSRVLRNSMTTSKIDMGQLVKEVWDETRKANEGRELKLKVTKILTGCGDRMLIGQVLLNLISNAVKFTKNRVPGIIEIRSYTDSDKIVYSFKDNGVGFDMAFYNKLFGVFQRLHDNEEYEGTGVGLAIVQRIINRHGGRVWAEGEVDKGATFYFTLPAPQE